MTDLVENTAKGVMNTFRIDSQNYNILEYLKTGKSLTVEEARLLGFGANLRSRISNIEDKGFKIKRERVSFNGGFVHRYSLEH